VWWYSVCCIAFWSSPASSMMHCSRLHLIQVFGEIFSLLVSN
jgi:hypothetical protein